MRIVAISDTHGFHDQVVLPEGDVLIHAGDFCNYGDAPDVFRFNHWLLRQPFRHKIIVAGNHDVVFERQASYARSLLYDCTYLQNDAVTIDGVIFYGAPQQPEFNNWAFNVPRGEAIRKYWDQIPTDTDVLITHGPPFKFLDYCTVNPPNKSVGTLEEQLESGVVTQLGCKDLAEAVLRVRPKVHIFGHFHLGYGEVVQDGTHFINAAICNDAYQPVNQPIVLDI